MQKKRLRRFPGNHLELSWRHPRNLPDENGFDTYVGLFVGIDSETGEQVNCYAEVYFEERGWVFDPEALGDGVLYPKLVCWMPFPDPPEKQANLC